MVMPNFFIIGAPKAGTSSAYNYLRQHPQVFMSPVKEPYFFQFIGETIEVKGPKDRDLPIYKMAVTDTNTYKSLFNGADKFKAVGEASPLYLYSSKACTNIYSTLPQAKLIVFLRNPVDRAYSSYLHMVREGLETSEDFSQALAQEDWRIRENWAWLFHYKRLSLYYPHVKRYKDVFGPDQFRVYLYEDFEKNPLGVIQRIFDFLEVDPTFNPDVSLRHNVTGVPRSRWLHKFLREEHPIKSWIRPIFSEDFIVRMLVTIRNLNLNKPELTEYSRNALLEMFRDDIRQLQTLINRDLSNWLV